MTKQKQLFRPFAALLAILMLTTAIFTVPASATTLSTTGYSISQQPVYTGPSDDYATMGTIYANERVYLHGQEQGWYHIIYDTSNGKQKSGYVPVSSITNISGGTIGEERFIGGFVYANKAQTVYSCYDRTTAVSIGSISYREGVTKLYEYYAPASDGSTHHVYFIEYSTSSGPKRGYVFNPDFTQPFNTCVGRMTMNCNIYYAGSEDRNYCDTGTIGRSGFIYAGEYVSVIAKNGDELFVEYNTNNGRKRGVVNSNYVYLFSSPGTFNDVPFYINASLMSFDVTGTIKIYGGPSTTYAHIDTLYAGDEFIWDLKTGENGYVMIQ